jgi:hypothetical protein
MNFGPTDWTIYVGLFVLGLVVMGLLFAFVYGCEKV